MWQMRTAYRSLARKHDQQRQFDMCWGVCEGNVKTELADKI